MPVSTDAARRAWASTRIQAHEETYLLVSVPVTRLRDASLLVASTRSAFAALLREPTEVTLTVSEDEWSPRASGLPEARVDGPYRAITLDVELPLDLVGYLAPAASRLAEAGIGIVPQCGYRTDHLLVHGHDLDRAVALLESWIATCAESENG